MIPPAVLIIGIQGQSQSNSQYSPCQNLQRRVSHILLKLLLKHLRIELKDTANSKEPAPYLSRAAVVRPQTVAEWELGIPPDPTRRSALKFLFKAKSIRVFKNWATTHPVTALIRS